MAALQRRRLGRILVGLGLAIIVIAVVVVLEIANGPGTGPKAFAQRRGYDQVKVDVQRSFPLALLAALGGMALAIAGARLARRSEEVESKLGPTDALHGGDT